MPGYTEEVLKKWDFLPKQKVRMNAIELQPFQNWKSKPDYNSTPLYKFFHKKSIVQGFLIYNEFVTTITKESDPVRQTYYTTRTT